MKAVIKNNAELLKIRGLQFKPGFKKRSLFRDFKYLSDCAKKADRIVWHSFRTNDGYCPFILYLNRKLLKKSTWIAGEGELGNYTSVPNKLLNRYTKKVNDYVQHNISCIGIDFPTDKEKIKELGFTHPKVRTLTYPYSVAEKNMLQRCMNAKSTDLPKKTPIMQIGMSSQRINRHIRLVSVLGNISWRDNCYLSLNFCSALAGTRFAAGTKVNKDMVKDSVEKMNGRMLVKDKVLSEDQYFKALQCVDMVMLANKESCQMRTLLCLLAMKKRIFAPGDSPLYENLNKMGANIHLHVKLIRSKSLADIAKLSGSNLPKRLVDYYSDTEILKRWIKWSKTDYERGNSK